MYKTTFLANLARAAGRQHPFFSQNVSSANSSALSLVKPKLGLATERSYFSSWGNNGYNASNASTPAGSQTVLIAISTDDNQAWEKDLGKHRKQFRSIAGIRRYSTGTRTVTETSANEGRLQLTGAPAGEDHTTSDDLDVSSSQDSAYPEQDHPIPSPPAKSNAQKLLEDQLKTLLARQDYGTICETVHERLLESDNTDLTLESCNMFFESVVKLDSYAIGMGVEKKYQFCSVPSVLQYYKAILERQIVPDTQTFCFLLNFLLNHRNDVQEQRHILKYNAFLQNTPQDAFLAPNRKVLEDQDDINAADVAIDVFLASISVREHQYPPDIVNGIMNACVYTGRLDDAIHVFDYMGQTGMNRKAKTYSALLAAFAKAKDLPGAIECFNMWKADCRKLDPHDYFIIYDAMVRCYFAVGDHKGAMDFFNAAVNETDWIDPRHHMNVVECYARCMMFEEALSYAKQHLGRGNSFSEALGEIVHNACRNGRCDLARQYYTEVKSLSAFHDASSAAWTFLGTLIVEGQLDEAVTFVKECVRQQVELRLMHLSFLVSKLLAAGRLTDAFEIVDFVGERRASSYRVEMNKVKLALFTDIFLTDLLNHNLVDEKSLPSIIRIATSLGRVPTQQTTLRFFEHVQKEVPESQLANDSQFVAELPKHLLASLSAAGIRRDEISSEITLRAQNLVRWALDISRLAMSPSTNPSPAPDSLEALKTLASTFDLQADYDAMTQTSQQPSSESEGLAQLPAIRAVFLSEVDPRVNSLLSGEIVRAMASADPKLYGKARADHKLPYKRIVAFFRDASETQQVIDGDVLMKAVNHFGRCGELDNAQALMDMSSSLLPRMIKNPSYLPAATALLYDAAIIAFNELSDNVSALHYHDLVLELGFAPSANAYASFIAKMDENVHRDGATRAMALFNEARRLGVRPTEYLFNTVIAKLAKARRNEEALDLFNEMKSIGLMPNGVTYGTIINSCCRVGCTALAEDLLLEMEALPKGQSRIAPYNTLIQHFIQTKKDRAKAFFYWDKLIARAIPPTPHSYRLLIEAHGHLEPCNARAAESVLDLMRAHRAPIGSIHIAAIIHMYGIILRDLPSARQRFDTWTRGDRPRVRPDDVLYQSIVEAHVKNGDIKGMQRLLQDMQRNRVPINAYIANLAIEGYGQENQLDLARSVFDGLPSSGLGNLKKEPSTYESMIRAYNASSQPQKSAEILDLLKLQHYPDAVVHRASALVAA